MVNNFEWIVVNPDPKSDRRNTRSRIRAHAMRATAASRKKLLQASLPQSSENPPEDGAYKTLLAESSVPLEGVGLEPPERRNRQGPRILLPEDATDRLCIPPPMPLSGLDRVTADIGIDVLDLSVLTAVHIGVAASTRLSTQPSHLLRLVTKRKPSYLNFVPSRYGQSACLDDAVYCTALRARRVLLSPGSKPDVMELSLYGKALRSLRDAVYDSSDEWQHAEVQCAIQVLGIFELLDLSSPSAWAQHVAGAAHLIQLKGPDSFQTEFEKQLLCAIAGAIVCECLRKNEACFLDNDPWQNLICSTAANLTYARRGYMGISLLCLMTRMPRLMRDVTNVVNDPDSVTIDALNSLTARIRRYWASLKKWRARFDGLLPNLRHGERGSPTTDETFELLCGNMTLQSLSCRMMSAISMDSVVELEEEALSLSTKVLDAEKQASPGNVWAGFYVAQKCAITGATVRTRDVWKRGASNSRVIEKWRFKAWCDEIPRSCGAD